jgi:oligoendopeptidase F
MAGNAGYDDFRQYQWRQKHRFAYSPEDAATFQQAIAEVGVPAASRVYQRYRRRLGVTQLRPWDVKADVFPFNLPAIRPFADTNELEARAALIFHQVDPVLGNYFNIMRQEALLDLPNRKGKAPGAYCTNYPTRKRPFIFMNSVGSGEDVRTMLHEAGHAFHNFERNNLPYQPQKASPMEFSEVASMAMELLAIPYLPQERGGFFSTEELTRWQNGLLEKIILFWPYMAIVDAFQHWAYTHPKQGIQPDACDAKWAELWQRYIPDIDFSGFEDVMVTGWQRKQHIFRSPFYYIEYGLAQLGALQVWRNALTDQPQAVQAYRQALALGGTRPLPQLYSAAGVRFAFDQTIMKEMIQLLEDQLYSLNGASPT